MIPTAKNVDLPRLVFRRPQRQQFINFQRFQRRVTQGLAADLCIRERPIADRCFVFASPRAP